MNRRIFSLLLVFAMVIAMVPVDQAEAVTTSSYSPYAKIDYAYSSSVTCGTVRYISQVSSDSYFYSSYWPSSTFGYYTGPSVECGTASISMALSYIGVNKTPNDILSANNGATSFSTGWGGSTYYSYSASNLSGAMDAYINGNGKYSPPVIHIPGYSAAGHYVVVVGKISSGVYQILDPWQRALTQMTVSGSSATYTVYGSTIYDTIDQIHQWYNGSASLDYASGCTSYASYCQIKASKATVVNTQPCSAGSNGSTTIENAASGATYTAIKLFKNTGGNLWYQVTTSSGKVGYMYAGHVTYVKALTSDITVSGASAPNGHVAGSGYYINGTVSSKYNELTNVALYVHSGFGTSGTKKIGYSDTASGNSYPLLYSNIDSNTLFGNLTAGKYTYAIYASYKNYYATNATTLASKTGTLTLMDDYFVVIASSVSQSSCSHSYSTTTISAATCTASGSQVKSCSKCGLISESTTAATGHSYGSWTTVEATCTTAGSKTRTCANCGNSYKDNYVTATGHSWTNATCTEPMRCSTCGTTTGTALGHSYVDGTCQSCGDKLPSEVVKPGFEFTGASLLFEDEIFYNFYFKPSNTADVVEYGIITFTTKLADGTHADAVDVIPGAVDNGNGTYTVRTNGIAAKEMGDWLYFRVYAKLTDGSYAYATTYGYRATAYANTVLSGNSDTKTKALMVAMLNYGAAAQTYFSHNTDSLMNASLTEAQKALVDGYSADMLGAIVPADSSKTAAFPKDSTCYTPRIAVGFEGAFAVNYYFTPKHTPDGQLTMYYWDAATYNSISEMTRENATSVMTLEKQSDGSYLGAVEGIAAKEVDSTIYVALVYTSGGTEYCSGILAYSLGTYFKSVAGGTSTAQPLGAAVAVYSYYAKQYFAN